MARPLATRGAESQGAPARSLAWASATSTAKGGSCSRSFPTLDNAVRSAVVSRVEPGVGDEYHASDERGERDVSARPAGPAEANGSGRGAAVGVPLSNGWSWLEAGAAWRLRVRAGRGGGFGARAGAAAAGAAR